MMINCARHDCVMCLSRLIYYLFILFFFKGLFLNLLVVCMPDVMSFDVKSAKDVDVKLFYINVTDFVIAKLSRLNSC